MTNRVKGDEGTNLFGDGAVSRVRKKFINHTNSKFQNNPNENIPGCLYLRSRTLMF